MTGEMESLPDDGAATATVRLRNDPRSLRPISGGYLAEQGMQWEPNPRNEKLKGHVYNSKEASSGGQRRDGGWVWL